MQHGTTGVSLLVWVVFFFKGLTFPENCLHPRDNDWQVDELVWGKAGRCRAKEKMDTLGLQHCLQPQLCKSEPANSQQTEKHVLLYPSLDFTWIICLTRLLKDSTQRQSDAECPIIAKRSPVLHQPYFPLLVLLHTALSYLYLAML